jgi:putative toxin-antitoxin system antitoxin component (TIGR02293 family)
MASKRMGMVRSRAVLTAQKLGGKKLLGVAVRSEADWIPIIERGLPLASLSALTKDALSAEEVDRLILPRRTLSHRRAKNQPLSRAESERAVRIASITSLAEDTFGDKDKADVWLRRPTTALGGQRPIDLLDNEVGARLVEQLLYRIAYGIAA